MRKLLGGLGLLMLIVSLIAAVPVKAQTSAAAKKIETSRKYDAQSESTLSGTVQSVISNPTAGMLIGVHLILSTSSGTVDADLGPFALKGSNPVSVGVGEAVTVVGVMMTVRKSQVFMTGTLQTPQQTYTLRNQNGVPLLPSNGAPSSTPLQKGALR